MSILYCPNEILSEIMVHLEPTDQELRRLSECRRYDRDPSFVNTLCSLAQTHRELMPTANMHLWRKFPGLWALERLAQCVCLVLGYA